MIKLVVVMRKDLHMRRGKEMAQSGHAILGVMLKEKWMSNNFIIIKMTKYMKEWLENSFTKITLYVNSEEELIELYNKVNESGIPVVLIEDNGNTEFHGVKTPTCLGIGPWKSEDIDVFTGHLKLL